MPIFDVNNDKVIQFTAKLEELSKSAFPSAVRNTLNKAAFETKKQIPKSAEKVFVTRHKPFFKNFSIVEKSSGNNIEKMASIVGINSSKNRELADNLEAQEFGGMVNGKKLIPHDDARSSKSQKKKVAAPNRLNKVSIHDGTKAFKAHKGTRKSKFVAAVMSTAKSGKKHMMIKTGTSGMVYEVTSVSQNIKTKKINFKIKKLYSVRSVKSHNVKSHKFMKTSADIVSKNIEEYYYENAEYQFNKILNQK